MGKSRLTSCLPIVCALALLALPAAALAGDTRRCS